MQNLRNLLVEKLAVLVAGQVVNQAQEQARRFVTHEHNRLAKMVLLTQEVRLRIADAIEDRRET